MQQKRLDYLDMAKGIGIFLVILGHIEYIQEDTLKWLSSFHMPLFFVVGGILVYLRRDTGRTAFETIGSRIRGVLTPYLSFSLMLLVMNTITSIRNPETLSGTALARQYLDTFTGYGVHILWFLPAYFIAGAVFALLQGMREWKRNLAIILLALGAYGLSAGLGLESVCDLEMQPGWIYRLRFAYHDASGSSGPAVSADGLVSGEDSEGLVYDFADSGKPAGAPVSRV